MAGTIVSDTIQNGVGASTSTTNVISGSLRAWVTFNGTTGSTFATFNVSSVTRTGTGDYTVNFTTAFANTNYVIIASARNASGIFGVECGQNYNTTQAVASCRMYCTNDGGGAFDSPYYSAMYTSA